MNNLQKKIIITGHSRGLGKALTSHYQRNGYAVMGISRTITAETNIHIEPLLTQVTLDLSQTDQLISWLSGSLLTEFLATASEIILINNAGSAHPNAILGRQSASEITTTIALNVTAPLLLSNAVMQAKPKNRYLKIVHISSGEGRKSYPGWSVYGATKAALDQHALCIAAEQHIDVAIASIAPGVVDTGMQAQIRQAKSVDFPLLSRFQDLAQNGGLTAPTSTAECIATLIQAANFGRQIILDVREPSINA